MNTNDSVETGKAPAKKRAFVLMALLGAVMGLPGAASGVVRTDIPSEDPGPPFYARVERAAVHTDIVPNNGEWGAVVFYRSPACVPDGFNLMDLFDPPRAFDCSLTMDGYEVWRNGPPPTDMIPMFAKLDGLGALPVWFASWSDIQAAVADDELTIEELQALPSLLMGTALLYRENLHPTDGAEEPKLWIRAYGLLHDGRSFELRHFGREGLVETTIRFD